MQVHNSRDSKVTNRHSYARRQVQVSHPCAFMSAGTGPWIFSLYNQSRHAGPDQ